MYIHVFPSLVTGSQTNTASTIPAPAVPEVESEMPQSSSSQDSSSNSAGNCRTEKRVRRPPDRYEAGFS